MQDFDCVVVGGGVIGAAILRELALRGHRALLIERNARVGMETSSRNSGVIHAGLYYPGGSLKARCCIEGRELLYAFCAECGVPHRRIGKLVVASGAAQLAQVEAIAATALANGAHEVRMIDAAAVRALEPELAAHGALWSPMTGIVDAQALLYAYLGVAQDQGAEMALGVTVDRVASTSEGFEIFVDGDPSPALGTRWLVNAAGLGAQALARRIEGFPSARIPPLHLAKGNYFRAAGRVPFSHLIYPVPEPGGLGVHLTLDLDGAARFGPDVQWVDQPDYRVDAARAQAFEAAVRQWWPGLPQGSLQPDFAGLRPKLTGPGEAAADFCIDGPAEHGMAGLVQLFGIESPGITASMALARRVVDIVAMETR
jgi:L-2-hydroxyglutarate oxidase LhgO